MLIFVLAAMALMTLTGQATAPAQSVRVVQLITTRPGICVAIPVGHGLTIVLDQYLVERVAGQRAHRPADVPAGMVALRAERARALLRSTGTRRDALGCRINDAVMRNRHGQHVAPDWVYLVRALFRHGRVGVWSGAVGSFLAQAEEVGMDEHCRTGLDGFFILQTLGGSMLLSARTCHADRFRPPRVNVNASIDLRYQKAHPARYPLVAIKHHDEGTVVLRVEVGTEGQVIDVVPDREATHAAGSLIAAAIRAARYWRYNPAAVRGVPITAWIRVPVTFHLPVHASPAPPSSS